MDFNRNAFRIVKALTEGQAKRSRGKAGGRNGGPARAKALSPERRREIAIQANQARWKRAKPQGIDTIVKAH